MTSDTIAAITTPAGAGAVAMIRLSGEHAIEITNSIFTSLQPGRALTNLSGYQAVRGHLHRGGEVLDEVIAIVYRAPRSYTGEDVVELCCHGGVYLTQQVLQLCLDAGARPAEAGEFTRRAFLGGRLNLAQAEAVGDLIAAQGEAARKAAIAARGGVLSTEIQKLVEILVAQQAHLSAWADYPEEEIEAVGESGLIATLESAMETISRLLATRARGAMIREGITTAIVGRPNVGKSTLMNLMSGESTSIVTELPGTTRDIVRETVRVGPYCLNLVDTAGIRDTQDPVERIGVERAQAQLQSAQLVLAVLDGACPLPDTDRALLAQVRAQPCIAVVNKSDLPAGLDLAEVRSLVSHVAVLSAHTGAGLAELEQLIEQVLGLNAFDAGGAILANARQYDCVRRAGEAVREALDALRLGATLDAVGVCLDEALDALLSLTGERATERVVDEVFARFCVGK